MKFVEKWFVAFLVVATMAVGPRCAFAGDSPKDKATDKDIKLSPSIGADRPLGNPSGGVKISRNGRHIMIGGGRNIFSQYEMWDGETGRRLLHVEKTALEPFPPHVDSVHHIRNADVDETGRWIVTGSMFNFGYTSDLFRAQLVVRGSLADVWDAESGRLVRTFVLDDQRLGAVGAVSRNGEHVACIDHFLNAKLWDRETGRELASVKGKLPPESRPFLFLSFSDDLTRFAALVDRQNDVSDRRLSARGSIYLCDLSTRRTRIVDLLPEAKAWDRASAMTGDGREVAVFLDAGERHMVVLLDFETGAIKARLPEPDREHERITHMSYGPDGSTIILGFPDGHLNLIDLRNQARVELRVSDGSVRAAAYLADRGLVRVVAARRLIWNEDHSELHHAGPMRIADFAVRFPSPSP